MLKTPGGFSCPKCGNESHDHAIQVRRIERGDSSSVAIVTHREDEYVTVPVTCPKCGNREAFRSVSVVAGEHAGIRQERSVERLKCTRCQYSWSRT
jgi:DNA-directed RNA polymerase subunit M/transcription elongation factor TFIIS